MRILMRQKLLVYFLLSALVLNFSSYGQDIKVNGGFLSDSLKTGEQTAFYLSAKYPSNLTLLFPDSSYGFAPFEFQKKLYFATETTDGISADSTVYYLTTFELDRTQYLELPVYLVNPQDCTIYTSNQDSVRLIQLVGAIPDSITIQKLPLKMNTAYHAVNFQFNYFILIIAGAVLLVAAVLIWIVFGKRIALYFKTKKLQKRHADFVNAYNETVRQVQKAFSAANTESAVSLWKKYMEQLEALPYTKLTTRETLLLRKDDFLSRNLTAIDRAVYGNDTTVVDSLENLKTFADQRFSKKLEEVKHGK